MGAGALLRDGKVQMSQIPTPLPGALPGWGQSSPCQVLARQGNVLGAGAGCQGSGERKEERGAKAPVLSAPDSWVFSFW